MLSMQFLRKFLEPLLPSFFFERTFFYLELWQWASLLCAAIIATFISYACARLSLMVARRILDKHIHNFDKKTLRTTFKPLRLIFLIILIAIVVPLIDLDDKPAILVARILKIAVIFSFSWLSFGIFDVAMTLLTQRVMQKGRATILAALPLLRRAGKTIISILAALVILQNLGVQVTALIAGLGVGGIAIALASQKTLENLVGGVMIILDQPIRVGQELRFGTQQGIVEDIGLRSTRIRTFERSVVAVPNLELSQMHLENLSLRDRIRFTTTFGLRYETSPEQMRHVLIEIRKILYAHPKIDREPARVRFVNFGQQSLDIEITAYVLTSSTSEHLAVKEDILLRVMDVVKASGAAFAIPCQVMYTSHHDFLDDNAKLAAEQSVTELRKNHQLPLPEFSDSQILELDDTIDYPPTGCANGDPRARYS